MCCAVLSHSVASDSTRPHGLQPAGSPVHGILQARIVEWVAMSSSKGPSQPKDQTQVSHVAGEFFTDWATREHRQRSLGKLRRPLQLTAAQGSYRSTGLLAKIEAQNTPQATQRGKTAPSFCWLKSQWWQSWFDLTGSDTLLPKTKEGLVMSAWPLLEEWGGKRSFPSPASNSLLITKL